MVPPSDDLWEPFEPSFFQITSWSERAKICFALFSQSFLVLPSYFFPTQSEKSQFNLKKNKSKHFNSMKKNSCSHFEYDHTEMFFSKSFNLPHFTKGLRIYPCSLQKIFNDVL